MCGSVSVCVCVCSKDVHVHRNLHTNTLQSRAPAKPAEKAARAQLDDDATTITDSDDVDEDDVQNDEIKRESFAQVLGMLVRITVYCCVVLCTCAPRVYANARVYCKDTHSHRHTFRSYHILYMYLQVPLCDVCYVYTHIIMSLWLYRRVAHMLRH